MPQWLFEVPMRGVVGPLRMQMMVACSSLDSPVAHGPPGLSRSRGSKTGRSRICADPGAGLATLYECNRPAVGRQPPSHTLRNL